MVEFEIRSLHTDEVFRPETADRGKTFLEARAEPAARYAEGLDLDIAVADAGAEHELTAAEQIERGQLFGKVERLVQRNQHQPANNPQTRCDRGAIGQERYLLHGLEGVRAVV